MLTNGLERGFTECNLPLIKNPKMGRDKVGWYIYTFSENAKVYFEDFYRFLEKTEIKALREIKDLEKKLGETPESNQESLAYYRAKKIIIEQILKHLYICYSDSKNLSSIMTPWCFGTVVLEKVEIYHDKISKGQVQDKNIPEYPFYVLQYIDEIRKKVLLDLFSFPEKALSMRWQYSELLKRYSKVLSNVTSSLQSVLTMIKSQGL
ncbi:MAG: hypothetical protein JSU85_04160 [Candidatus Zixiibacteriota bacterium]|nr:MAG: hypothetical protein JSU85_04160 [candidate division Zixibacteria bacterium]